jgi:hypothetical protein
MTIVARGLGRGAAIGSIVLGGLGRTVEIIIEVIENQVYGSGLGGFKPSDRLTSLYSIKVKIRYKEHEWKQDYELPRILSDLFIDPYHKIKNKIQEVKAWLLREKPLKIDNQIEVKAYFKDSRK